MVIWFLINLYICVIVHCIVTAMILLKCNYSWRKYLNFFGLTLTPQMVIFGFKFCKMVTYISWFLSNFLYSVLFGGTRNLGFLILCYIPESHRILDELPKERLCKKIVAMLCKIRSKLIQTYHSKLFLL